MTNYKLYLTSAFSVLLLAFCISCVNGKRKEAADDKEVVASASTFPYDLENPVKYNMPQNLFEISGIVFHNGDPKQVFAIQDEDGDLFYLGLNDKQSKYTKFGGKGDYEDLTIIKNQVIVLKSNGELHIFPLSEINKPEVADVVKVKDLVPKAEYEGLAADEKTGKVYVLTKGSKADDKNKATSIFAFDFNGDNTLKPSGEFSLAYSEIEKLSGEKKVKFKPSALAKNPGTGEWYVLSSVNKMLVITDTNFKVKAVHSLKGGNFNQPEGIAFDKDGNLYISNEGGTTASGDILQFKLKK
ncbi:SdiA-regulated domain-containing protein [Pedobacter rhodius]|uniref:SdiA-regulated domain-containing protein n=1 Tax=Pedobacter rhodius TaxID=3004098 RepID=A0ABT4KZG9_9SPHI|nr:SdiA-regulated domain-containing protein [Pedobacter sp. SJ11]MCZ4223243.1 SdiA-regulated domain-containing protein [Pedobacter sp. SJ11]